MQTFADWLVLAAEALESAIRRLCDAEANAVNPVMRSEAGRLAASATGLRGRVLATQEHFQRSPLWTSAQPSEASAVAPSAHSFGDNECPDATAAEKLATWGKPL